MPPLEAENQEHLNSPASDTFDPRLSFDNSLTVRPLLPTPQAWAISLSNDGPSLLGVSKTSYAERFKECEQN